MNFKNTSKIFAYIVIFFTIFNCNGLLKAINAETKNIAAVLVIDVSGSMHHTDPQRIVRDGSQIFLDLLPSETSKIGIIPFDERILPVFPFIELNNIHARRQASKFINDIEFGQHDTDFGLALQAAYTMLDNLPKDVNTKPIVVFFTDGMIDLKHAYNAGRNPRNQRNAFIAEELSRNDVTDILASNRYPIYAIGLYPTHGVPDRFKISDIDIEFLHNIARTTGTGKALIARDAKELRNYFIQLYADITSERFQEFPERILFDDENLDVQQLIIPSFVRVANIAIFHDTSVSFTLVNPAGVSVFEGNDVFFQVAEKQTVINIVNPTPGLWHLRMKGHLGATVNTTLIRQFNFDMKISTEPQKITANKNVNFFAEFVLPDDSIQDISDFDNTLSNVKAFLHVNGNPIGEMTFQNNKFELEHVFTESGEMLIEVILDSQYFERQAALQVNVRPLWMFTLSRILMFLPLLPLVIVLIKKNKTKHHRFPDYFYKNKDREAKNGVSFKINISGDTTLKSPQSAIFTPHIMKKDKIKETGTLIFFKKDGDFNLTEIDVKVVNSGSMELYGWQTLLSKIQGKNIEIMIGKEKLEEDKKYYIYYDTDSIVVTYSKEGQTTKIKQSCCFKEDCLEK